MTKYLANSYAQGISAIVLYRDRYLGQRSSGLMLIVWLMLVIYGTVKFRTYILLILDQVWDSLYRNE